jgi:hypothetical protein
MKNLISILDESRIRECVDGWLKTIQGRIPLFELQPSTLDPIQHHKDRRFIRSKELSEKIEQIRQIFLKRFPKNCPVPNGIGICYLIYQIDNNESLLPLYVGIAEAKGKNQKLSALFSSKNQMRFADRYGSNGHIGNINESLFKGKKNYYHWIARIFSKNKKSLNLPTFVHVEIWDENSHSIFPILGATPNWVEEKIRIWFLRETGYALLNKDGNR